MADLLLMGVVEGKPPQEGSSIQASQPLTRRIASSKEQNAKILLF
jgi:hypothetical protein